MPVYTTSAANAGDLPAKEDTIDPKLPADAKPGVWIGIDLGTSFSSAAIWSIDDARAKLLRLGGTACHNLAAPPKYKDGNYKKAGKIVPSAALFLSGVDAVEGSRRTTKSTKHQKRSAGERRLTAATLNMSEAIRDALDDVQSCEGIIGPQTDVSVLLGFAASRAVDQSFQESLASSSASCGDEQLSRAYITSIKRVLGITAAQVKKELVEDKDFVNSLPFQTEVVEKKNNDEPNALPDGKTTGKANIDMLAGTKNTDEDVDEGVLVHVSPLLAGTKTNPIGTIQLSPMQIVALLLRSIRLEAEQSLQKHKLNAPGSEDRGNNVVRNCVVGVPAHFGRIQRRTVMNACKMAGFDGHVTTITESTAAAMAYGVFVSPKSAAKNDDDDDGNGENGEKKHNRNKTILVFDMGGGTTDVTICEMTPDASRRFKVVATVGDHRLGGDDVDEALVQFVETRMSDKSDGIARKEKRILQQKCRAAKEELCGNGGDPPPAQEVTIEIQKTEIAISQDQFKEIIKPFVLRADRIVEEALDAYASQLKVRRGKIMMDEVVLVGGSSRVPAVRKMLKEKFDEVPELCFSIKPEAAVSQGAAVQAAILSGCVAMHELRSAMMLDSLPHALGVLVPADNGGDEAYIPILRKDMPLPALNAKPFFLADIDQPGITIVAVEDIGDEFPLQRLGEFTFLLHQLTDEQKAELGGRRKVEVGFIVDENGKFTVSFFDELDPDHQEKKRKYLEMKRRAGELAGEGSKNINHVRTREEVFLNMAVIAVLLLYVGIKLAFAQRPDEVYSI